MNERIGYMDIHIFLLSQIHQKIFIKFFGSLLVKKNVFSALAEIYPDTLFLFTKAKWAFNIYKKIQRR